ncbi:MULTISPECIES: class I SAM-dependent methyltransferase [Trichocoleus]|uniref:Class I SAM-dependent methyltransferase n=1 Tax=Trichocoleus desertorum GB2-A4 TaxID=2933944 RepID=A0ABV0JDI4_9CYAN|nr:class I SAM-dependent methyltransferase [Trichocoleus sp. FACHB-46]MBD1861235.1 class I SAM-dependent methyltransferase [Trichocoleus sp. FACHB-46]
MNNQVSELERIRQQFEMAPYPTIPLEESPKEATNILYLHNLVTAFYLKNHKITDTKDKIILDVGCGSGYTSLILAEANPGAKIVGMDISEKSVELARQRLRYHGFDNSEFYTLTAEELPSLNLQFDYINCDEVLYLLPDPVAGLQAMKAVLKTNGIIRANLHSSLQREFYFRAQKIFKMMGLMDGPPEELEIEIVREIMRSLKPDVYLKLMAWKPALETDVEQVRANLLLQGDKGYTVKELFAALKAADLEFVSMVKWRQWEIMDLFQDPNDLPSFLAMSLPDISVEERLHLFELLQPVNRLLDFWCAHPIESANPRSASEWSLAEWQRAQVQLHPQLKIPVVKKKLIEHITERQPFNISQFIPEPAKTSVIVDSHIATCLLPLWEGSQSFVSLVKRWQAVKPVDPITLEPLSEQVALEEVRQFLGDLEVYLYVLAEVVQ